MKISRGLRNNNPLNIRKNGTKWKGLADDQNDKSFFTFTSPAWGYRAAFITLRNYRLIHDCRTLRSWIYRWAPPVENDTKTYLHFVERNSGIGAEENPDTDSAEVMCSIVAAMSHMENGIPARMEDVRAGWELSVKNRHAVKGRF